MDEDLSRRAWGDMPCISTRTLGDGWVEEIRGGVSRPRHVMVEDGPLTFYVSRSAFVQAEESRQIASMEIHTDHINGLVAALQAAQTQLRETGQHEGGVGQELLLDWLREAEFWDNCCENFSPHDALEDHAEWCIVARSLKAVGLQRLEDVPPRTAVDDSDHSSLKYGQGSTKDDDDQGVPV